ncbi:MAG: hypothetical protein KDJ29_04980, partial [Hyphomicrobiales bacterium]|nr:hypothetical protein [Hyphomicrobiales bacterium]
MNEMRKTFKREAALASLVALFALAAYAMATNDPALVTARAAIVAALALPVFAFVAAAFGLDWAAKQTGLVSGAQAP